MRVGVRTHGMSRSLGPPGSLTGRVTGRTRLSLRSLTLGVWVEVRGAYLSGFTVSRLPLSTRSRSTRVRLFDDPLASSRRSPGVPVSGGDDAPTKVDTSVRGFRDPGSSTRTRGLRGKDGSPGTP